jgi:hypothetical protein
VSRDALRHVLEELPPPLREEIRGYVSSVEQSAKPIFDQASLSFDSTLLDEFLFAIAIRRLWAIVDTQYWVLTYSLSLLRDKGVRTIRVPGASYGFGTDGYLDARQLRNSLEKLLTKQGISYVIGSGSLADVLSHIAAEKSSGRQGS